MFESTCIYCHILVIALKPKISWLVYWAQRGADTNMGICNVTYISKIVEA